MAILVTGAAGLVGRAAVAALLRQGVEHVRAVVREPAQVEALRRLGAKVALLDATDPDGLAAAMDGVFTACSLTGSLWSPPGEDPYAAVVEPAEVFLAPPAPPGSAGWCVPRRAGPGQPPPGRQGRGRADGRRLRPGARHPALHPRVRPGSAVPGAAGGHRAGPGAGRRPPAGRARLGWGRGRRHRHRRRRRRADRHLVAVRPDPARPRRPGRRRPWRAGRKRHLARAGRRPAPTPAGPGSQPARPGSGTDSWATRPCPLRPGWSRPRWPRRWTGAPGPGGRGLPGRLDG